MAQVTTHQSHADLAVVTGDGLQHRPLEPDAEGALRFTADGQPGLYQLSVVLDASDYDWDLLYEPLHRYHNHGQRTGPWDFSINHGTVPVVPAYWVTRDGRRVGLWYVRRVSLEDLERKRFRGRMAFFLDEPTEFELQPYREMRVRWQAAVLEPDPEDSIEPPPEGIRDAARYAPAAQWADAGLWERLRQALDGSHALYREPLERAMRWALRDGAGIRGLPALLAAWRIGGYEEALTPALEAVDDTLALPAFGNPHPEAYGHHGDMRAMYQLLNLAWAYHALRDELGEERRDRVREKMRVHGELFLEQALLMRDYWGGSILQDHGWKSMFGFGAAALHMLGEIPEAERWVGYIIPRLRRSLDAMPRDGVIPGTSHYRLFLYTDEVTHYRDALLALSGEDIFDGPQFAPIVDFLAAVYDPRTTRTTGGRSDAEPFFGGNLFLNRMAARYADGRAAWLQEELLRNTDPDFCHGNHPYAQHLGTVHGLLSYEPSIEAQAPPPMSGRLRHFEDSGVAHYRNDEAGAVLSVKCGPYASHTGESRATCPCDLLGEAPGAGHFSLVIDGIPLLATPDGGYRLKTFLRSVLLVDDRGQHGDVGYPMSIPSWRHRGERIEVARFDEDTGRGLIRLDLQPAYDGELGLLVYTREFELCPRRRLVVRDRVVCDRPRTLSWLFQTREDRGLRVDGLTTHIGTEPALAIRPHGLDLTASRRDTEVVWSYSSRNHFRPFVHVRYDTTAPVESAVVEFAITW